MASGPYDIASEEYRRASEGILRRVEECAKDYASLDAVMSKAVRDGSIRLSSCRMTIGVRHSHPKGLAELLCARFGPGLQIDAAEPELRGNEYWFGMYANPQKVESMKAYQAGALNPAVSSSDGAGLLPMFAGVCFGIAAVGALQHYAKA